MVIGAEVPQSEGSVAQGTGSYIRPVRRGNTNRSTKDAQNHDFRRHGQMIPAPVRCLRYRGRTVLLEKAILLIVFDHVQGVKTILFFWRTSFGGRPPSVHFNIHSCTSNSEKPFIQSRFLI